MRTSCINLYIEFFASLSAAMTSTRPVLPVNFCTVGSSRHVSSHLAHEIATNTHIEPHEDVVLLWRRSVTIRIVIHRRPRKPTFSSPIVNFPCVCLFAEAKDSSFLIGSDCMTLMPNLTLPLVYSWPGCGVGQQEFSRRQEDTCVRRPWCRLAS